MTFKCKTYCDGCGLEIIDYMLKPRMDITYYRKYVANSSTVSPKYITIHFHDEHCIPKALFNFLEKKLRRDKS